jgi:hypothetical protein
MPRKRIVTKEIADYIYKSYEALRLDKVKPEKVLELIRSDIEEGFGVRIGLGTIEDYSHQTFDKFKKCQREYQKENKNKISEYRREYQQKNTKPRNTNFPVIIDVFNGFDVELTSRQIWEKTGGNLINIRHFLHDYYKSGILIRRKKGGGFVYRLNPESPFYVVAGNFFKEKEEELFGKWFVKEKLV